MKIFKKIRKYFFPLVPALFWCLFRIGKIMRYSKNPLKYPFEDRSKLFKGILNKITKLMKINMVVEGRENLIKDPVVYISNHQALYDPFITATFDGYTSFLAKKELNEVILVKRFARMVESVFLDREDLRAAVKANRAELELLKRNISMWITPEGTRSKNENRDMLEFKGGALKPAYNAQVPIIPIVLDDTWKAIDTYEEIAPTVYYKILKPIYYEEYKDMSTESLAIYLHDLIEKELIKLRENKNKKV